MASEIKVDTVSEKTSGSGVTIDGLLIKDGGISGDVSLIGTTPTFTIGDAGAEDAALVFDGKFIQGHFIVGKTQPETEIWIDKKKVKVSKDGFFAFGIGRDRKYDIVITSIKNGKKDRITKKIE